MKFFTKNLPTWAIDIILWMQDVGIEAYYVYMTHILIYNQYVSNFIQYLKYNKLL